MSINLKAYEPLLRAAKEAGVRRFINASSSSVYGVKEEQRVTEDLPTEPITLYAQCKAEGEKIVRSFESADFRTISVRSATLCGYSPRQRLDLTVNILTNYAVNKGRIVVHGGSQQRPNIHVEDIADFYVSLVEMETEAWDGRAYNVGYQNHSVSQIAHIVRETIGANEVEIEVTDTQDLRSYRIDSTLVAERLGFYPKRRVEDAVLDLKKAFDKGLLPDSLNDSRYFNVKAMKAMGIG
jgi:nucleoside-diphosphate-sugar epimerase